ncbi:hypothetical protein ACTFIY_005548 [Dictyostelium cf. discoideum]
MELFYNKNILNRDIERNLTTKELQDYFNEGLLYIISKDYYEITNDEIKEIGTISNNKLSIKENEKEIFKLILKNRNSNCFKIYFEKFGFTDEFDIEKNGIIIYYIFWNLNIKGLKKIIEKGFLKKVSLSIVGEINLSNDWSEFLELFLSQRNVVQINNIDKWFNDIFSKIIIKAKLENDYTDLNKFQKIISNVDSLSNTYKRYIISNYHLLHLIDNFNIYKWFYQLFLQFEIKKPPNHSFIINSRDQVDFLVEKVYKEHDDIHFRIDFENYELVNYFIEKGKQVGKDFTQFQTDLFSSLFNRSLEIYDIETLKIISSLGLKFRSDSLLKFNEPLSKIQIIELINFLNSIEFNCFKKPISYSLFYNLINLCKNNGLTSLDVKINFNGIPKDSLTIFITALTYSDTVLEFILNSSKFTLYLKDFEKEITQNPIRNHAYYKGIMDHHLLYENNIKLLISKFKSNELIYFSNVINSLYLNLLFSTQLNHNKSMSEIEGNYFLKKNINNLEKLFILNGIGIKVTLNHVTRWLMLKSKSFNAYFQKFNSFLENKELSNEMVTHFSFSTILNSETSELFSKIRKLFFKYKSKNFKDNLEFLLHYKYYDLVIEQIIQYENNSKRSSFLGTIATIMPSSLPIEEFQKLPLETICNNIPFSEFISKLIDLSIKFDRFDIFKYLLSSHDNQNLLFDHFPILDKLKIEFLEFFLIYKNDLFVKHMETHLPYNFSKLKQNEICVNLLSKYLPSHYQMKEFFDK